MKTIDGLFTKKNKQIDSVNEVNTNNKIRTIISNKNFRQINKENPYNDLDALVISNFSYLPIGKVDIPTYEGRIKEMAIKNLTISQIVSQIDEHKILFDERFYDNTNIVGKDNCERDSFYEFFKGLSQNERYKNLKVLDYKSILNSNKDNICQFCAFFIEIEKDKEYIFVNRGTDRTMEGWYEDSKIIYQITDGQIQSLNYFNELAIKYPKGKIHITGHSKGGNNSYYTLLNVNENLYNRLDMVVFDALLFNKNFVEETSLQMNKVRDLGITKFINIENSFFGEILFGLEESTNKNNLLYIKSFHKMYLLEHTLYSISIKDMKFEETKLSDSGWLLKKTFSTIILEKPNELKIFFETIFSILGTSTINSVINNNLSNREKMILLIKNIIKINDKSLIISSRIFNELNNEFKMIFNLKENSQHEDLIECHTHEKEDGKKINSILNSLIISKFTLETLDDVVKLKDSLNIILMILTKKQIKESNKSSGFIIGSIISLFSINKK